MDDNASNINPLAVLFLVAMSFVTLNGSRQAAVRALLAIAAFLPLGQQLVVFGLNFQFFRILILVGMFRVITRGDAKGFVFTIVDKLFVAWAVAGMVSGAIRNPSGIMGETCMGGAFNAFGAYFLIRFLIHNFEEAVEHLKLLAVVAVLIAGAMAYEVVTHKNLFFVFGGVPEFVGERDGRFRCQGPFRHPILAGTFAATLFPLMVGLWFQDRRARMLAILGMAGCMYSTVVAASSGALLTVVATMVGFALWPMRNHMKLVRRGMVAVIAVFAVTMQAPVWYLISKVSDVLGGTGWHRSFLIDQAVGHFSEWWMVGSGYTAHWAPAGQVLAVDPNNMDITNHYIAQGLQGGAMRLALFIATIVVCFKIIGRFVRSEVETNISPKLGWALGVSLAGHCTAFVSISYFDQIVVFWYYLLGVIAAVPAYALQKSIELETTTPTSTTDDPFADPYATAPSPSN